MLRSRATLEAELRNTTRSLREACPAEFWESFRIWQLAMQELNQAEIEKHNASLGQVRTNFLKHLSYRGAVRLPPSMSDCKQLVWACSKTSQRYMDCLNSNYAEMFKMAWPRSSFAALSAFPSMGDEKLGDYIEALMGWHYIRTVDNGEHIDHIAEDLVILIEAASLAKWCLSNGGFARLLTPSP